VTEASAEGTPIKKAAEKRDNLTLFAKDPVSGLATNVPLKVRVVKKKDRQNNQSSTSRLS